MSRKILVFLSPFATHIWRLKRSLECYHFSVDNCHIPISVSGTRILESHQGLNLRFCIKISVAKPEFDPILRLISGFRRVWLALRIPKWVQSGRVVLKEGSNLASILKCTLKPQFDPNPTRFQVGLVPEGSKSG